MILDLLKKNINRIWVYSFMFLLFAPMPLFLLLREHLDTNDYEKRNKAPRPAISLASAGDLPDAFSSYFNDRLPFRNELIGLNSRIDYYIFGDSPSDRVIFGKDGWFFYTGAAVETSTGKTMLSNDELRSITSNLTEAKEYFDAHGIEFYVFIAPNKETVYRNMLPDYYPIVSDISVGRQLTDYLKANTDISVIWPYDDIMDISREHYTYCHLDTHWNNAGSYTGACALAGAMNVNMIPLSEQTLTPVRYSRGDLSDLMHLTFNDMDTDYNISGYEDKGYPVEQYYGEFIEFHNDSGDDRTVIMRRDSYGIRLARFLSGQFKDMYVMTSDSPMETIDMFDGDVFIYEIVERNAKDISINLPQK